MKINKFRKEKKLTQKLISENIGCHHKTIAYMDSRMDSHIMVQYLKFLRQNSFDLNEFFDQEITLKQNDPPEKVTQI
ncbi:hypothetical protein QW060_27005 [Myroides ceti]|uniref:XRE family transcriptional regulator n=1 Tax=Paenimyroides ceti TaxID=395087 RepID=A0ABT8D3F9_9FLAO|nr:hypothetical protein [Paenimyroides ceti]MDN3709949.1 hypothetical protein [Paenimyroides ceti]MDN3710451.1 hypothetical protein [Paenimyroides ceti]MDN3710466.1 hypothetical protein [Paenimyroides ceti]